MKDAYDIGTGATVDDDVGAAGGDAYDIESLSKPSQPKESTGDSNSLRVPPPRPTLRRAFLGPINSAVMDYVQGTDIGRKVLGPSSDEVVGGIGSQIDKHGLPGLFMPTRPISEKLNAGPSEEFKRTNPRLAGLAEGALDVVDSLASPGALMAGMLTGGLSSEAAIGSGLAKATKAVLSGAFAVDMSRVAAESAQASRDALDAGDVGGFFRAGVGTAAATLGALGAAAHVASIPAGEVKPPVIGRNESFPASMEALDPVENYVELRPEDIPGNPAEVVEKPAELKNPSEALKVEDIPEKPSEPLPVEPTQVAPQETAAAEPRPAVEVPQSELQPSNPVTAEIVDRAAKEIDERPENPSGFTEEELSKAVSGESDTAPRDHIEDALDNAIKATDPTGKVFDFITGVSYVVANRSLKLARAVYRKTKDLAQSVAAAVAHVRASVKGGWDEVELTKRLNEELAKETSKSLHKYTEFDSRYTPETEVEWNAKAQAAIDSAPGTGADKMRAAAGRFLTPDPTMDDAVRQIGLSKLRDEATRRGVNNSDPAMLDFSTELMENIRELRTKSGKALRSSQTSDAESAADTTVAAYWKMQSQGMARTGRKVGSQTPQAVVNGVKVAGQKAAGQVAQGIANAAGGGAQTPFTSKLGSILKQGLSGIDWRSIFTDSEVNRKQRQIDIYGRISQMPQFQALPPSEMVKLVNLLDQEWERQRNRIFRNEFRTLVPLPNIPKIQAKVEAAIPRFIQRVNLGLLDNHAALAEIAREFGEKVPDPAAARRIYQMAQDAQEKPNGAQRATAIQGVMDQMARETGVKPGDLVKSWWYASVLSGLSTQSRNVAGNLHSFFQNASAYTARNPAAAPRMIMGAIRGIANGVMGDFPAVMRGESPAMRVVGQIDRPSNALELITRDDPIYLRILSPGKYVGRFMTAVDSTMALANLEMTSEFLAHKEARNIGTSWSGAKALAASMLKTDLSDVVAAEHQAKTEAAAGRLVNDKESTIRRRRDEILRQARPDSIMDEAYQEALARTYNNVPQGLIGQITQYAIKLREDHPSITPIIPFLRISGNVTNTLIENSPAGLLKLWATRPGAEIGNMHKFFSGEEPLSVETWQQMRARIVLSHAVTSAMAMAAAQQLSNPEPDFQVTGSFDYIDPAKRKQLAAMGIFPYQIRAGGVGVDYRQSPGALPFAIIGNWMDSIRYGKFDEKEEQERLGMAVGSAFAAGHAVIIDQNFLSGVAGIMGRGEHTELGLWQRITRSTARALGGFVPGILKEIDTLVNPTTREAKGFMDNLQREIPVARWSMREMYNPLGEPVEIRKWPWSWAVKTGPDDAIWKVLNKKASEGVWLPKLGAGSWEEKDGSRTLMTDDELNHFQRDVGRGMRDQLDLHLDKFEAMDPKQSKEWLTKIHSAISQKVKAQIKKDH